DRNACRKRSGTIAPIRRPVRIMTRTPAMKHVLLCATSLAAVAAVGWAGAVASQNWMIGPRELPPPAHASPELKKILAEAPAPHPQAAMARVPKSIPEWKAFLAKSDAAAAENTQTAAKAMGVTIQEEQIAGVHVYRLTPPNVAPEHANQLFVHVHGGAFVKN